MTMSESPESPEKAIRDPSSGSVTEFDKSL